MQTIQLPIQNPYGYYEMRLESIGGLGANLCGKLMGELGAMILHLEASSFSSYGSEKRGSPVKAFIRYAPLGNTIHMNTSVIYPHLLGIFHEALIGKQDVTAGVSEVSTVVINTNKQPLEIQQRLHCAAKHIVCIDAQEIAIQYKSRVNMVMLGAICHATGFIELEKAEQLIKDTVGKKYPALLERNLEGLRQGYKQVKTHTFEKEEVYPFVPYTEIQYDWGYENAPIGGINPNYGSTITNDVSGSREGFFPEYIPERCIHCGLCESTCPDMVFQFFEGIYKGKQTMVNGGLDYTHCKGCLRCVEICPVDALKQKREEYGDTKQHFVPNRDLIQDITAFEDVGANSYVNSESEVEEERV